jgi:hypothetical protein
LRKTGCGKQGCCHATQNRRRATATYAALTRLDCGGEGQIQVIH